MHEISGKSGKLDNAPSHRAFVAPGPVWRNVGSPNSGIDYHDVKEGSATSSGLDILCVWKLNNRAELRTTKSEDTL